MRGASTLYVSFCMSRDHATHLFLNVYRTLASKRKRRYSMFVIRYLTDKGTRQSEPVTSLESARYLRAEILAKQKPQETEIVDLSGDHLSGDHLSGDHAPLTTNDLLWSILNEDEN